MTSIREGILSYVTTALTATAGISSRAYRSRPEAFSKAEAPAILIEPITDPATYTNMDKLEWTLQFKATVITRGLVPDSLADPIVVSLHSILMADRTLGGRCFDILPQGVNFNIIDGDNPIGVTDCIYAVRYRTSAQSLES